MGKFPNVQPTPLQGFRLYDGRIVETREEANDLSDVESRRQLLAEIILEATSHTNLRLDVDDIIGVAHAIASQFVLVPVESRFQSHEVLMAQSNRRDTESCLTAQQISDLVHRPCA